MYIPLYAYYIIVCLEILLYRNQAINVLCKSIEWFRYDSSFKWKVTPNRLHITVCIRTIFHISNSSSTDFSGWYFLSMFFGTREVFPKEAANKKKITENIIPVTTTHRQTAQIFLIYHLTWVALIFPNWSCLLSH